MLNAEKILMIWGSFSVSGPGPGPVGHLGGENEFPNLPMYPTGSCQGGCLKLKLIRRSYVNLHIFRPLDQLEHWWWGWSEGIQLQ